MSQNQGFQIFKIEFLREKKSIFQIGQKNHKLNIKLVLKTLRTGPQHPLAARDPTHEHNCPGYGALRSISVRVLRKWIFKIPGPSCVSPFSQNDKNRNLH